MKFTLKCCGKLDPIGADKLNIRLSFGLDGSVAPVSYRIDIRETETDMPVCDLTGDDSFTVWVDPKYLKDQTGYTWRVTVKTDDGAQITSQPACFETGISDWEGKWIGLPGQDGQVLAFQKSFTLPSKPKQARLYICGLGWFRPSLNGQLLSDSYFMPPVTDYSRREALVRDGTHAGQGHRVVYYTYDLTDRLRIGENTLYAEVAGGYYTYWEKKDYEPQPDFSFGDPCLIYELHIEDDRGNTQKIVSDSGTLARFTGENAGLYSGDRVDFTCCQEPFIPARYVTPPTGAMTAPQCGDDRVRQILTPVRSWQTAEGTVYDFGINHSGGLLFTARASEDTRLVIRYAEVLNGDGGLNYETAAWHGKHTLTGEKKHIYQTNSYRLKKGSNRIEPKFSWFCYRYVLIEHNPAVKAEDLQSLFIYMDIPRDGSFASAEPLLDRINDTFLQTLYCNMHSGLVMDCPHRERLPYTGDGKLIMASACYSLDAVDYYYKWFRDILDAQTAEGLIPNSAPYFGGGGGYAWGNALCTVTSLLYTMTADAAVAREGYRAVKKWLAYYGSKADENQIIRSNSHTWMLGDWLAPQVVASDVYYISTVCYLQAAKTALFLAQVAAPAECARWQSLITGITEGINRVFFHPENLCYGNGVQGENMLALAEGIVPEAYRGPMEAELRQHYTVETDYHLDTGIVLTPVLINYLTDHGFRDIAWRIMTAKTYPSYYDLMEDDTTFSEHWSKKWPDYYFGEPGNSRLVKGGGDLSHCHPMYGSVAAWLYERVAGLDLSELYLRKVQIKPCFMDCLPWAKAQKNTAFGQVMVQWHRDEAGCTLSLSVPRGLSAVCHFPAACKCLKNTQDGKIYYPDETGCFDFTLAAGQWLLTDQNTGGTV